MHIDGGCHCGNITYEADINPEAVSLCHCSDCQTMTGTAYRVNVRVKKANFKLSGGKLKLYVKTAESGNKRTQAFCPECGTPIYSTTNDADPQEFGLRVGTVRQRAQLPPFTREGLHCVLAARDAGKLKALCDETGATAIACDSGQAESVNALYARVDALCDAPAVVVYNASQRVRGPLAELDAKAVAAAINVTALGGFHVAQAAVQRMLKKSAGTIIFTGASASVKGYAQSATFAMGKFALRGLAQSMARELAPQNIHVAHVVIDGGISSAQRPVPADKPDSLLDPDAIAQSYVHLWLQQRSAWTWEIEVRPWVEKF